MKETSDPPRGRTCPTRRAGIAGDDEGVAARARVSLETVSRVVNAEQGGSAPLRTLEDVAREQQTASLAAGLDEEGRERVLVRPPARDGGGRHTRRGEHRGQSTALLTHRG